MHDLGKVQPEFQAMLIEQATRAGAQRSKRKVDHSSVGAAQARAVLRQVLGSVRRQRPELARALELLVTAPVASHHGRLPDGPEELEQRLDRALPALERVLALGPPRRALGAGAPQLSLPPWLRSAQGQAQHNERLLQAEMLVRMILSALVDADRLDAERVGDLDRPVGQRGSELRRGYAAISALRRQIDGAIDAKVAGIDAGSIEPSARRLHDYRQAVLEHCRAAAEMEPGAFRLDVATGGGKTLSSLSFALRHAERHGLERVILVIPFTSIIEQTASVLREALGALADNLVEHHSAAGELAARDVEAFDRASERRRLATESWDAPLIVTTGVQLFESLYASSASRCRKLAAVARSVVVIDEAQTLPPLLLDPVVWAINELVASYGSSVVLSTATQPSLERPFPEVRGVRSIVAETVPLPPPRVRVELVGSEEVAWPDLAAELAGHEQVLAITHRRADARELTRELDRRLGTEETLHLSALMCAAHRLELIGRIHELLKGGKPCRVVSTQLVEAGVDLDFPVVYRALAGVDSMIQAAGRANREGRLGEGGGLLRIFHAPSKPPPGLLRLAAEAAHAQLQQAGGDAARLDLFSRDTATAFFRRYFRKIGDMDQGIQRARLAFRYREVDRLMRFIGDQGTGVVIPYDEPARRAIRSLLEDSQPWRWMRRLQRYIVTIYPDALLRLVTQGAVEALLPDQEVGEHGLWLARTGPFDHYDTRFGLRIDEVEAPDPETLVI